MKFKKIIKIIIWLVLVLGIIIIITLIRRKYSGQTPQEGVMQNIREFLPFGRSNPLQIEESPTEELPPTQTEEENVAINRLRQISLFPITGAGIFTKETITENAESGLSEKSFEYFVRYVNKATGYVYQNSLEEQDERRITETLLPKTGEVVFGDNSEFVVFRYVEDGSTTIRSYLTKLPEIIEGGDSNLSITGEFLPDNITEIKTSPNKEKFFYLTKNANGSIGVVIDANGDNKKTIWEFPFNEWLVGWHSENSIFLNTKPGASSNGYVYRLNTENGSLDRVMGDKLGLTAISDFSGKKILYSFMEDGKNKLVLLDTETGIERDIPFSTLSEKCIFNTSGSIIYCGVPRTSPNGPLPDIWYRGQVSFNDSIWSIETETNSINLVVDIEEEVGQFIDVVNPLLDPEEKYLLFTNKKDGTLWSASL